MEAEPLKEASVSASSGFSNLQRSSPLGDHPVIRLHAAEQDAVGGRDLFPNRVVIEGPHPKYWKDGGAVSGLRITSRVILA